VTYHLKTKQIELASAAKHKNEQKQRDEALARKMAGNRKWIPKYFSEQGEHWIYIKPLVKRLQQPSPSSQ
jgi:hypothetical protein